MGYLDNTPDDSERALVAACMWAALVFGLALVVGIIRVSLRSL